MSARRALVLLLWASACPAFAQAAELFAGYSLLRVGGGSAHGASLGFGLPLRGALGLCAEGTAQFGNLRGEQLREWALTAGPVFAPWRARRLSPFATARAGLLRSRRQLEVFGVTIGTQGVCAADCPAETVFVAELGAGLDLRLAQGLGLRLVHASYRLARLEADEQSRLRLAAGLVLRFGR